MSPAETAGLTRNSPPAARMTIFDRYLLRRYWHVFIIAYLALFGLYFVIDVFTNVNDFLDQGGGMVAMLGEMARHYSYRACYFFGLIGGTIEVIAAMVALALVQKHGELNPVLSAGVPTYRLIQPLMLGALFVNALILVNQEFVIPRIAFELQRNAGSKENLRDKIEPVYDFATDLLIAAKRLNVDKQRLEEPEFVLKPPQTVDKLTTISAREAVPRPARKNQPAGWLLKGVSLRYDALTLTEAGKKVVIPGASPDELFIRTDVTIDRMFNPDKNFEFLSTLELMRRVRNPSFSQRSIRSQSIYLHTRITKPILNLIVVAVGVPFVVRRESTSLLTNMGICSTIMGLMFAVNELFGYLGKANLMPADMAAWAPVIVWGTVSAWATGLVRT